MLSPDLYRPVAPPFKHQEEALEAGWDREYFAYLLEMGLGKSRIAIENFAMLVEARLTEALLIIAPKSVYTNWTRVDRDQPGELQKWLWPSVAENARVHTYRAGRSSQDKSSLAAVMDRRSPGIRILAVNIEALSSTKDAYNLCYKFLKTHKTTIILDESTVIKNPQARRTKECIDLAPLASHRRILTGSLSSGSPTDAFSQFEFLGPKRALLGHRFITNFRSEFCVMREMVVSGRTIRVEVGAQNLDELASRIKKHSFRRRTEECLDLPEQIYLRRAVELHPDQKKMYADIRQHAMTEIGGKSVTTQLVITQMIRLHQVLCGHVRTDDGSILDVPNRRMEALEDLLAETDEQAIIWTAYRPDAGKIVRMLGEVYGEGKIAQWHGGRTTEEREADEAAFQEGRKRYMVATQSSGARGRTWTAARLAVYYSNSHDLELRQQSEKRNHRIGSVGESCRYVDLVAEGTLDEKIITSLRNGYDVVRAIMADGPGKWL